jgi:hypothetical protein
VGSNPTPAACSSRNLFTSRDSRALTHLQGLTFFYRLTPPETARSGSGLSRDCRAGPLARSAVPGHPVPSLPRFVADRHPPSDRAKSETHPQLIATGSFTSWKSTTASGRRSGRTVTATMRASRGHAHSSRKANSPRIRPRTSRSSSTGSRAKVGKGKTPSPAASSSAAFPCRVGQVSRRNPAPGRPWLAG